MLLARNYVLRRRMLGLTSSGQNLYGHIPGRSSGWRYRVDGLEDGYVKAKKIRIYRIWPISVSMTIPDLISQGMASLLSTQVSSITLFSAESRLMSYFATSSVSSSQHDIVQIQIPVDNAVSLYQS